MLSVLDRLRALLDEEGVEYRVVEHGETRTSEESAAARGEHLRIGGKALVLKVGDEFGIFVLSAADKLDSGAVISIPARSVTIGERPSSGGRSVRKSTALTR